MDEDTNNNNNNNNNNATLNNNETNLEEEEESKLNESLTLTLPIEESTANEKKPVTMKPLTDEQSHEQSTNQESNSSESRQENDLAKSSADDYSSIMKMLSDFKQSKLNKIDYNLETKSNEQSDDCTKKSEKKEEKENNNNNNDDENDEDNIETASTNTSYQELPSVCKSQTMADEAADHDQTNNLNNSEKEDTLDQSLLRKPGYLDQLAKKNNLLNTSMQSVTSQCTIDSLAKRVQSLVGPIDYKTKISSDLSISSSTNNNNNVNNNKKEDLSKHSSINYESIYKELDSIQDTLRMQHSFNKHLEKLTASRAEIKDLLLNDKLSESTFSTATKVSPLSSYTAMTNSVSSLDSCTKLNKDYLCNAGNKFTSSNYDTYSVNKLYASGDLRTFKEDETKYFSKKINDLKTDLEALSLINNSINKDLNTTSKFTVDLKSKLSSNYLTSSLSRMASLSDMPNKTMFSTSLTRPTSRSAFESDPDLLANKSKYQFMSRFGKSYANTDTETVESSHSESDDARSPLFSSHVYGTRGGANQTTLFTKLESPTKPHLVGIYDRKENGLVKRVDKPSDRLDPDYLREMDKKLKKLIKKNLSKDLKLNCQKENKKEDNQLAWEIDATNSMNKVGKKDESLLSQSSTAASYGHVSPPPHPYLPLRDVPMHDMVKKLQREFELEQNVMQCTEMNILWEEIKAKVESKTASETNQPDLANLNNLLKNPLKTLLKTELEQHSEQQTNKTNTSNPTTFTTSTHKTSSQQTNKQDESAKMKSLLTETLSSLKFDNLKNLNKEKIKEMIEFQKERHERRVKALEKLTKLERLQAEKLKKILQINDEITPQMYEMFIQQQNVNLCPDANETIGNETIVDLDEALKEENLSALINEEKKLNTNKRLKFNLSDSMLNKEDEEEITLQVDSSEKMRSKVEILNLKNTSVLEPPEGVCVVKETQQQQMKPEARVFFTIPCGDATATTNKFTSKSEPLISTQRLNKYKSSNISNKENDSVKKEPKKLSLQEAFELYKCDLISRSRQRQKEIQFRAEQRQRDLEYEAEQVESYQKRMKEQQTRKRLLMNTINKNGLSSKKSLMFEINVENFMHKRPMTTQDIKKQTKKIYEKLPEVKQKQLQLRAEELKRQNRLKSTLYRKTLQQRVLTRGPNFNLREAFVS